VVELRGGTDLTVTAGDGVDLAASVVGSRPGAPTLLLVHGFGGAKEDFADHVASLARDHVVVVFDHRGHGASGAPGSPASYSLDRLAADVVDVADAVGAGTFRLLGHSMGGMVARRVALTRPERVEALVLMGTSAGPPPGLDPALVQVGATVAAEQGMAALRLLLDAIDPLGSPAHERVLEQRPGFQEYCDRKWATLSPTMWSTLAVELVVQPDELTALGTLPCPTLVLVGEQDRTFVDASAAIARTVPDARLVVIPVAGHSPQFENPVAWYDALAGFLADLEARGGLSPRLPSPGTAPARRSLG
jgi:pimeloyl-ACP methyl ester carboxylesterase